MPAKLSIWSKEKAEATLKDRIRGAFDHRKVFENVWEQCERAVYNTRGRSLSKVFGLPLMDTVDFGLPDVDGSNSEVGVNYAFKNVRFLHAQLSANPPSIAIRPLTPDAQDRRKAEAAEALKGFFLRQYNLQEIYDQITLAALIYGTGIGKIIWDSDKGEVIDIDENDVCIMEGDISLKSVRPWDIAIDPDANKWEDVRYVIERQFIPWDEALFYWPDKEQELQSARLQEMSKDQTISALDQKKFDVVEIYEYWEKGLPHNGMLGRYAVCTRDGALLEAVTANPHRFSPPRREARMQNETARKELPPTAYLPYVWLTDMEVPNRVWGMSALSFAVTMQDVLNNIDSASLDNAYANGVNRLILPEGAEIAEGSLTNSPWDIVKTNGAPADQIKFVAPPPLPAPLVELREVFRKGIDDIFGVNEAMFGQQSRETSGFSMQYATNQGNMIRRRLFNKCTMLVESIYKNMFLLVQKHWDTKRTIHVMGDEMVMQAYSIVGADIIGGFDFVGEYGTNLSLDPITRREEIMSLWPLMEKAGEDPKRAMSMLKLNDFSKPTMTELGESRQKEIFSLMIKQRMYIPPEKDMDHDSMLAYCFYYRMTAEFRDLDPEAKGWIQKHIEERKALKAQGMAAGMAPPLSPGPAPAPGVPPAAPGMTGAPTEVTQLPPAQQQV